VNWSELGGTRGAQPPADSYTRRVSTQLTPGVETIEETRAKPSTGDGDHERFSHYVAKDKLADAMINGTPVVALCGKVWVPSRDPKKYPVCPECKEIHDGMPPGEDRPEG
jgi:Protein of unknown function (DUF3039)